MNMNKKMMSIALCGAVLVAPAFAETAVAPSVGAKPAVSAEEKISQYINGNLFGIQNIRRMPTGASCPLCLSDERRCRPR